MIYRTRPPAAPLRPFVESLWYHQGVTTEHALERLLPDGAIELMFDLTETPKQWLESSDGGRAHSVRNCWISGQHGRHIVIESAKQSCMLGARFRPGGAYPFLGLPAAEINDTVVEMELLWGPGIRELRQRLLEATTVEERFALLEQALLVRAGGQLEPDPYLGRALARLAARPGEIQIRSLAEDLGVSQKRLVRTFADKVGLRPKTYARVVRFQTVLRKLESEARVSWSFIAHDAGYYDQAHFIRDFETLSGLRPSRYLVEKGEFLNFVPLR